MNWQEFFKKNNKRELPFRLHKYLNDIFPQNKEIIGVEIGVLEGLNSSAMLNSCSRLQLTCVDPWFLHFIKNSAYAYDPSVAPQKVHEDFNKRFKDLNFCNKTFKKALSNLKPYSSRVNIFPMFSVEASFFFENEALDFVYLDGDHSYAGVLEDIEVWYSKIKSGGYIFGHDFRYDGSGVEQAIMEFLKYHDYNLIYSTHPAHEFVIGPL